MLGKKIKLMSSNVRGLGGDEKCNVVRNVIKNLRCDIVVFQETKCNRMDYAYAVHFLPSFFSNEMAYNLSINSAGGTIIAWKHSYQLLSSWSTRHTVSVRLRKLGSDMEFSVTNAYGPIANALKEDFVNELRLCAELNNHPWILLGDFNLTRWLVDRSSGNHSFALMDLFNGFISDAGINDIQLLNRSFTWTSKRPVPSFSKLDRVFVSSEWITAYPVVILEALELLVSDHTPLVLTCKGVQQQRRNVRMELFWFTYQMPKTMVQQVWGNLSETQEGSIAAFYDRVTLLQKALSLW